MSMYVKDIIDKKALTVKNFHSDKLLYLTMSANQ